MSDDDCDAVEVVPDTRRSNSVCRFCRSPVRGPPDGGQQTHDEYDAALGATPPGGTEPSVETSAAADARFQGRRLRRRRCAGRLRVRTLPPRPDARTSWSRCLGAIAPVAPAWSNRWSRHAPAADRPIGSSLMNITRTLRKG